MDSTSISLLRRLGQPNHESAWTRFVDLYAPLIYQWGENQGLNTADAADLVQEVLSILVHKLPEFEYDPKRRFRGWLFTVTANKAKDLHRRNSVRPESGNENTVDHIPVASNVDLFEETEYHNYLVKRALTLMQSEFTDPTWQACWKHVVEDKKAAEVAQELGISTNMVYLAKSRILRRLREELKDVL
ncbi:MAG: RNA polymerase sigma factor [Pirellulales bacterium]|jgi:RNA polymerase sigma-70 factor (ECF subfamily)